MFAKHAPNKGFRLRIFTSHILTVNLYPEYIKIFQNQQYKSFDAYQMVKLSM